MCSTQCTLAHTQYIYIYSSAHSIVFGLLSSVFTRIIIIYGSIIFYTNRAIRKPNISLARYTDQNCWCSIVLRCIFILLHFTHVAFMVRKNNTLICFSVCSEFYIPFLKQSSFQAGALNSFFPSTSLFNR